MLRVESLLLLQLLRLISVFCIMVDDSAQQPPKKRGNYKKVAPGLKELKDAQLNILARRVMAYKQEHGSLPDGYYPNILFTEEVRRVNEPLNIDRQAVRNRITKLEKEARKEAEKAANQSAQNLQATREAVAAAAAVAASSEAAASAAPFSELTQENANATDSSELSHPTDSSELSHPTEQILNNDEQSSTDTPDSALPSTVPPRNRGGRPVGTTDANKAAKKVQEAQAKNWIVEQIAAAKEKADGSKIKHGLLKELVDEVKAHPDFSLLDESFDVSRQLIDARLKAGRHTVWHPGSSSPVLPVEPILISMITAA
jgi:hypothetical protein